MTDNYTVSYVIVAVGGAVGAAVRFAAARWFTPIGSLYPWGTFWVNLTGAFIIGFLYPLTLERLVSGELRLGVITGFVGGYTTFASFALDAMQLLQRGVFKLAVLYLVATTTGGLCAVWLGASLARRMLMVP